MVDGVAVIPERAPPVNGGGYHEGFWPFADFPSMVNAIDTKLRDSGVTVLDGA